MLAQKLGGPVDAVTMRAAAPVLAACLIVRDEAPAISACLGPLTGLADEVIVYDTGSVDDTVNLALAAGAEVRSGYWDDDFSRARNAAATAASATWVLSVDADETVLGDAAQLADLLAAARDVDGFAVQITQVGDSAANGEQIRAVKLFRRTSCHWVGRVHETVRPLGGTELRLEPMPVELLRIEHRGYQSQKTMTEKSRRNAVLGLQELSELSGDPNARPVEVVRVLFDLGRSLVGCDQKQDAVAALTLARSLLEPHESVHVVQATELLARLALGAGQYRQAGELIAQLRHAGARADYCDWLQAQTLAQQGHAKQAETLLASITELVDPSGRRHDPRQLVEMRSLVAQLVTITLRESA